MKSGIKLFIMMVLALLGGMLCRYYCHTDDKGYITTSKNGWFKVNYTRSLCATFYGYTDYDVNRLFFIVWHLHLFLKNKL